MKYISRSKNESGFTLIEMAVVVVIVGIVISIMATVLPSLIQSAKIRKARAILEKVDYSLEGYISASGQCPCPDTDGDGKENRTPGSNPPVDDTCVDYVGDLPYLTLGLSSGEDNWHNPIKYAVYEDLIKTTSSTGSNYYCYKLRDIINYYRTNPPDTSKLYTTLGSDNTNQAYVIVSGGPKDLDGAGGFFDKLNIGSDVQFESPIKIVDKDYDDLVRAVSFNYLRGRECGGDGGGGGGGGGVENSYPDGCTNGIDDDGDLMIDCDDPDCFGHSACLAGGENVQIATTSVASGNVNDENYSVTFTASGGITPYEWELLNNGAFTDFYLHPYTGRLSGTLSQCPGDYSIQVKVVDSTQPAATSDTESFNIEVTSNLQVTRTSGDGSTNITWDSTSQEETFEVNGGHIGDIGWTLDTSGATGFVYGATGDTTYIKKNGTTTPNTYTFILTATDDACAGNTDNIVLTVVVTESGSGSPTTEGMVAEWRMDECGWDGTAEEVIDSGENSLNGTSQNGADTTGAGKICRAGVFDGTNDYISVDSTAELKQTTAFSIAFWVKVNANASDWVRLAGKGNSTNRNYGLWLATNGTILFQIYSAGGNSNAQTTVTVNDGNWHHVVGVYDLSTMKVYIDNVERKSVNYSQTPRTSNDPFTIGYAGFHTYLNGCLDEVMLLHKALPATSETETSVDTIYDLTRSSCTGDCYTEPVAEYRMENFPWNGTTSEVKDSGTGASNGVAAAHGTGVLPSQTTPSGGKVCRAGVFTVDANNGGYLDLGDPTDGDLDPYTDPWTISAWIKWNGATGENIIYNKENLYETRVNGGYVNYAWQPHWAWDGGTSFPVTADEWTYVTTVYDGSRQLLYKNGDMVYSRAQTGAMGNNSSKLLIGARGSASPNDFFGGMIDEVKIYNRALAENEIKADKDETRDCSADTVVITTTELSDGTIYSAYSYIITATGGEEPPGGYGWEIVLSDIPGLSIGSNTGKLNGTIDKCAGDYNITVRVTDAHNRTDERTFTLTVVNGTLTIFPSAPRTFNCTTSDFSRDFSVSGPRGGALENWDITWIPVSGPGGFEVIKTGDATVRFRKIGTSDTDTYQFKLTANDSTCANNTIDSGFYILNISGDGAGAPYYAGRQGEWWLDDESGQITDYSGNGNHGTASGGVTYGLQGKVWTALEFDGSSGYVDCGNNESLDVDAGDFTVGAWVKSLLVPDGGFFVDKGTGSLVDGYGLAIIGGKFAFVTDGSNGAGGKITLTAAASVTVDTWYHVVGVRESGVKTLYINKIAEPTQADTRELRDTSRHFLIGKPDADGGYFQGLVDEVVFYKRALSQSEINDLYNQASLIAYYKMDESEGGTAPGGKDIYDYSGQANHGTNSGAAYGADGQIEYALEFDGTDDYVDIPTDATTLDITGDISISLWFYPDDLDSNLITNRYNFSGNEHGYHLQAKSDGTILWSSHDGVTNANAACIAHSTGIITQSQWNHIVVTKAGDSTTVNFYINGGSAGTDTVQRAAIGYSGSYTNRWIGAGYDSFTYSGSYEFGSKRFTDGRIDEVRIYNQVLSVDEVADLYNKGIEEGG